MAAWFISDVHLEPHRPDAAKRFLDFTRAAAAHATHVYILGDLFEAWIGDDDDDPGLAPIVGALADLSSAGVSCAFMHGNRDFLVGEVFSAATGCRLLGDFETVDLFGEPVLLTHGDLLCTDDVRYMELRKTVRDPAWQREFLAKPLAERRQIADSLRALSQTEIAAKPEEIMDVNAGAVAQAMRAAGVRKLVHGHTHRPAVHRFDLDGREAARIVLGAWYEHGTLVRWDETGFALETLD